MSNRPRLLLADDHQIVLDGLRRLLDPEFDVIGTVSDGRQLVVAAADVKPDVIVADVSMPELNGIEATRQILAADPDARIVLLTMHPDVTYALRAQEAGASAYVLKHSASTELVTAIGEALAGRHYMAPALVDAVARGRREPNRSDTADQLTPRQREVLQLLAEGRSAKEIAARLGLSARTVEHHKYRLMERIGVRTNAELIRYAVQHGIAAR